MSGTAPEQLLGKYAIRGTLGRGAMGTVYDGWDKAIDRRVAIKTVRLPEANDEEAQEGLARFKREAQAAGRLHHPNIVGVYDYGETEDAAFIVMEFVDGRSLKQVLDGGERLPVAETVRIVQDILAGLAYSHGRGVVHRDIKPANIMITEAGQAKIADFGIARIESSSMTQAGTVMGTPAYMSPEQFMGQTVDRRTDIYSLGVLLFQLLTGERPFEGSLTAIMHKALNTQPPAPSDLSVTAPVALDAVVRRAMGRRPEDRFDSAEVFGEALTKATAAPVADADATVVAAPPRAEPPRTAPLPAQPAPSAPLPRRNWMPLAAAGVALLLAAAGGAWFLLPGKPQPIVAASVDPAPAASLPPPVGDAGSSAMPASEPAAPPPPAEPPVAAPFSPPAAAPFSPPASRTEPVLAPVRSASAVSAALAAALPGVACTLAQAAVAADGRVVVTGLAGQDAPEAALRQSVASAGPAATEWGVASFDGPYCPLLDLLRPVAGGLALTEADGRTSLADDEVIAVAMTMPGFGGYLHLAYVQHDGTVSPLVPGVGYPARAYAAGERAEFGRPRPGFAGWRVGSPFGTDMIVAVASSAPLFSAKLPDTQPLAAYLRALQAAADGLRRRGGSIAAAAILLETRPGH